MNCINLLFEWDLAWAYEGRWPLWSSRFSVTRHLKTGFVSTRYVSHLCYVALLSPSVHSLVELEDLYEKSDSRVVMDLKLLSLKLCLVALYDKQVAPHAKVTRRGYPYHSLPRLQFRLLTLSLGVQCGSRFHLRIGQAHASLIWLDHRFAHAMASLG